MVTLLAKDDLQFTRQIDELKIGGKAAHILAVILRKTNIYLYTKAKQRHSFQFHLTRCTSRNSDKITEETSVKTAIILVN